MSLRRPFLLSALAGPLLLIALHGFAPAPESEGPGRPVVLMLHGRGVESLDPVALRREWLDALNRGLVSAGAFPLLGEDDLRLVWYADAMDPREPTECGAAGPGDATGPAHELASVLGSVGRLLGLVAEWTGEHEAAALRSLAGDLLYLGDPRKRCPAEDRLARALAEARDEGRPVVLVAHSFGSLVAYHHFRTRDSAAAAPVERYVTIGSLIGRPEVREILVGPEGRVTALPPGVRSWVNVRDPRDPFAAPVLGARTDSTSAGALRDVVTERVHGGDPHDAARYLADPATARAVLGGWCAALPSGRRAESACASAEPAPPAR